MNAMQDLKRNPGKWNSLRVEDKSPERREKAIERKGPDGHDMVLVTRLDEDGNPKRRWGYDETGRHTRVENTTYKCVNCGVETGTRPTCRSVECE